MDNSLLVGLSAQRVLRRHLDVTANNLANLNTTAYKAQALLQRQRAEHPATEGNSERKIAYADDWLTVHDMSHGPLQHTSSPMDVAIDGDGFFMVEDNTGERFYTRDGRFGFDAQGTLVLRSGGRPGISLAVLDDTGAPITLAPEETDLIITPQGQISQQQNVIGRLGIYAVADPQQLEKARSGLWHIDGEQIADDTSQIAQGYLESSNVQAIAELTEMIRITRAYEGVARMLSQIGQLRSSAIDALAEVTG